MQRGCLGGGTAATRLFLNGALALGLMIVLCFVAVPSSNAAPRVTLPVANFNNTGPIQDLVHPVQFTLDSEDSSVAFTALGWQGWGRRATTATGTATTCDYNGICDSGAVTLRAGHRRRNCLGKRWYDHAVATGIPDYGGGTIELPVIAPDPVPGPICHRHH